MARRPRKHFFANALRETAVCRAVRLVPLAPSRPVLRLPSAQRLDGHDAARRFGGPPPFEFLGLEPVALDQVAFAGATCPVRRLAAVGFMPLSNIAVQRLRRSCFDAFVQRCKTH